MLLPVALHSTIIICIDKSFRHSTSLKFDFFSLSLSRALLLLFSNFSNVAVFHLIPCLPTAPPPLLSRKCKPTHLSSLALAASPPRLLSIAREPILVDNAGRLVLFPDSRRQGMVQSKKVQNPIGRRRRLLSRSIAPVIKPELSPKTTWLGGM
jgi:hypothetical protein